MDRKSGSFIGGAYATALGTLASRVLGLLRDIATAALLGLGASGVMDALVVAVRVPNLFRRLFGEGALVAAFVPEFAAARLRSAAEGWKLFSSVLVWLSGILLAMVLLCELGLFVVWLLLRQDPAATLLVQLVAASLPYVVAICIASLLAATLQSLGQFAIPAAAPALLNICWLLAAWLVAPAVSNDQTVRAWIIVVAIQIAGVLQVAVLWPSLRKAGLRIQIDWRASATSTRKIGRAVAVVAFGLAITQLNTLMDSLIAWTFAASPGEGRTISWLGGVAYPLETGAASAIHFGERFYQLPLGVMGLAIATAIFPQLARHAASHDHRQLGADLTFGLRLTFFLGVPATVGMMLIAQPMAVLIYQHGEFSSTDALRTGRMISTYASAIWAFCAIPVAARGFYALGEQRVPVRIGVLVVVVNLLLDLTLIWWLGEVALALSTSLAGILQLGLLLMIFQRRHPVLSVPSLVRGLLGTLAATSMLVAAILLMRSMISPGSSWWQRAAVLAGEIGIGSIAFFATARLLKLPETSLFPGHSAQSVADEQQ
jgi:putative peptidoglycan lipid II flippase